MQWIIRVTAVGMLCSGACAGDWEVQKEFPGVDNDRTISRSIERAERAYKDRNFKQARWLYETRLSPVGDKFAQYMIGYMYANGEGTQQNPELAAAWFLLAAERGNPDLLAISNEALEALTPEARGRARAKAEALRAEHGDQQLLRRLLREDKDSMRVQTGSRSERCNQNSVVRMSSVDQTQESISVEGYCRFIRSRIEKRQTYLDQYTVHGDVEKPAD
ncbi:MAG: SEL1-like repeat protein [Pseudomonadota bacterium]